MPSPLINPDLRPKRYSLVGRKNDWDVRRDLLRRLSRTLCDGGHPPQSSKSSNNEARDHEGR